jgi:ribose 5-phosphate isomerase RpiB
MRIGIIQASSQRGKNPVLYRCTCRALAQNGRGDTVVNYGVFPEEDAAFSYVETAVCISLLLCGGAADFIVTGCSSGQGMMLACNSLPGVLCGYAPTPQDAFLFGRINGGNALSLPLGLNYGWMGEINLQCTLDRLFDGPFGCGYPPEEAERKRRDMALLQGLGRITKKTLPEAFPQYDPALTRKALQWTAVRQDILSHGTNPEILALLE